MRKECQLTWIKCMLHAKPEWEPRSLTGKDLDRPPRLEPTAIPDKPVPPGGHFPATEGQPVRSARPWMK